MEKKCYRIERTIDAGQHGMALLDFLRKNLKVSHRTLSAIKYKGGRLLIDGEERTVRHILKEGEVLTVIFPPETPSGFLVSKPMALDIVFEDDFLMAVNKPAGIPVIPTHLDPTGALANGLLAHFENERRASTVHIVNRLDRGTSGLMLIAKHRYGHERLFRMQKKRQIHRRYLAFIDGCPDKKEGMIDAPIGRKDGSIIERTVDWQEGKRSVTHYKVLQSFADRSLAVVRLETGRTHQIRVHFSSIGHPLMGDDLYGGPMESIGRQALHCFEVSLIHPLTEQPLHLYAGLPADMLALAGRPINLKTI
ncbi:RluA family pseudouridine synthase [Sporolactobacillus sp. THM7-7]|nr:RluA family pseudouridine synthase [Sporolactobacillus sp. THM7-7]